MVTDRNPDFEQVQRKPLKEEIFEILHKRIIAGKFAPGDWLRQEEISSQLGVSQTPVREALDLLVSAGLAEREPFRGVRVTHLTSEEIAESYGLRLFLECTATTMAASRITSDQIQNLSRIVEQTRNLMTLNDMSTQRHLSREFHLAVVEASGNSLLVKIYGLVINYFPDWMLYEYIFRHPELLEESLVQEYQEHMEIVNSLAAHDPARSSRVTFVHIQNLGKELIGFLGIPEELLTAKEIQFAVEKQGSSFT
jgi:DNA-binding GntR family transcriptional regulator